MSTHHHLADSAPRSRARRVAALVLAAASVTGASALVGSHASAAVRPGADGRIAFWYDVPDDGTTSADLVTVKPDGTDMKIVVDSNANGPVDGVGHPTWSPDGTKLAFVGWSTELAQWTVFIVDADGSDLTLATYVEAGETKNFKDMWNLDWAVDGRIWMAGQREMVFAAYDPATRTLTPYASVGDVNCGSYCANPSVSPDGTKLAFSDWTDVWVAPVTDVTKAVRVMTGNAHVTWTPDGRVAARETGNTHGIVVADPVENATVTKLNDNGVSPAFAPSGTSFIYLVKGGNNTLMKADIDGSDPVDLTAAWNLNGKMGAMDWYSIQPPAAPARPTVEATGKGVVKVNWTAPASGVPITRYTARAFTQASGGSAVESCTTTGARTCTINGLKSGTKYWVSVTATSSAGAGTASARAVVETWDKPGPARDVKVKADKKSLKVSWEAPKETGGSKITGYTAEAYASKTAKNPVKTCSTDGERSCTIKGLEAGKSYFVSVTAENAVGKGEATKFETGKPT